LLKISDEFKEIELLPLLFVTRGFYRLTVSSPSFRRLTEDSDLVIAAGYKTEFRFAERARSQRETPSRRFSAFDLTDNRARHRNLSTASQWWPKVLARKLPASYALFLQSCEE